MYCLFHISSVFFVTVVVTPKLRFWKANHRSSNIVRKCYPREYFLLTNENPFSFCLRKSFCCPPLSATSFGSSRSTFWEHTIHTPFVIRSNSTTRFLVFRFLYQNKFPWQAIFVLRNFNHLLLHLGIHVHLFSRKIQKQRSEQPSFALAMTVNTSILLFLGSGSRSVERWKAIEAFSFVAI